MQGFIGSSLQLGIALFKNRQTLTGQTVSVRVIRQSTGAQLLAATPVPETSEPGVYNYSWAHNLDNPTDVIALYTVGRKTFAESIQIIRTDVEQIETLLGQVIDEGILQGDLTDLGTLSGAIDDDNSLVGTILEDLLEGTLLDGGELLGVIPTC